MKINLLKWPFYCFAGLACITILTVSFLISYLYFPNPYSIFTNYVSELGNPLRNPQGAIYFNVGAILTGISLFPFFIGIHLWYSEVTWKNVFLIASQLSGAFAAFSLILVGFFPENYLIEHLFWSYSFFFSIMTFIILTCIVLLTHPDFMREITYLGFTLAVIFFIFFYLVVNNMYSWLNYFLEWVVMLGIFCYIGLITYNMFKVKFS